MMRAAIPVLISSLVFSSLISHSQGMANRSLIGSVFKSQNMISLKSQPKRNTPEGATPHRGTGRRSLIESFSNAHLIA
jgi:hypothetical protein